MSDVVDRIDDLVADEKCPHCDRGWHQLALTRQVASMFDRGRFDADYFSREDLSPIVCDGSSFIGPLRPEPTYASGGALHSDGYPYTFGSIGINVASPWAIYHPGYNDPFKKAQAAFVKMFDAIQILTLTESHFDLKLWLSSAPEPVCPGPVPDVDVEFGPQNWLPAQEPVKVPAATKVSVVQRWDHFTKPEPVPVPASPGYDFTAFQGDEPKYPTKKKGHHEGFRAPRSR